MGKPPRVSAKKTRVGRGVIGRHSHDQIGRSLSWAIINHTGITA